MRTPAGRPSYIGKPGVNPNGEPDGGWGHHENNYGLDGATIAADGQSTSGPGQLRHQLP